MSTWTVERARVAALSRDRRPDDPELINARRSMKAARIETQARDLVAVADSYPSLSTEQRDAVLAAFAGFSTGRVAMS